MVFLDIPFQYRLKSKLFCFTIPWKIVLLVVIVLIPSAPNVVRSEQSTSSNTDIGWRATYTQIHFDDVETLLPSVGPAFILTSIGSLTDNQGEIITGEHSIKGSYTGADYYTAYLRTDPSVLSLTPLQTYRVTFDYRILVTPDQGFETLFYSPTGGNDGVWLPSITITGQAGDSGAATLTNTLANYLDYEARWNIVGTGAIVIDNIRIVNITTGQTVATEDAEQLAPSLAPGLGLSPFGGANVTTDPGQVIAGNASVRLSQFGTLETDPNFLPLLPSTPYMVEFDYRILEPGTNDQIVYVWFQPVGTTDPVSHVSARSTLKNAETTGTFSAGALTADAPGYYLSIQAAENASIIIDNVRIIRQDILPISNQPANWVLLPWTPYPRLGNYLQGTTTWIAQDAVAEGVPFTYSVNQIEARLGLADVVAGVYIGNQTSDPDLAHRLRQINPQIIILPYRIAQEQSMDPDAQPPPDATIDPFYDFLEGVVDEWIVKDTNGNPVSDPDWIDIRKMNISEFSPVVNGQTFNDYLTDWVLNTVMASGVWDGIFFDNLFGRINPHILNYNDPALLDYDVNLNRLPDETPAWASDMTRAAANQVLETLRAEVGNLEIIMGNTGPHPEIFLAPQVNGFLFECLDDTWDAEWFSGFSEARWRRALDDYFTMQTNTMAPHINIIEGCGRTGAFVEPDHNYLEPTEEDIRAHRFTLGTALLGDGFYEYDLFDARSAPYWFDEYTVDEQGIAIEDGRYKGYLGLALNGVMELTTPSTTIWEEHFEDGTLPSEMWASPGVYASQNSGDIISGTGSLVIDNPNHTQRAYISTGTDSTQVVLTLGETYVVEFDWIILESLDEFVGANIWGGDYNPAAYRVPGVVAGDAGRAQFPLTLESGSDFTIGFTLGGGGGKVAIDNIHVTQGGAGPWRRDFENGFVLVNPINRPYTFNASELAGPLNRTGIKRILGSQAPLVNNGQPVTDTLTLQPFDAMILLADHIASNNQLNRIFLPLTLKE